MAPHSRGLSSYPGPAPRLHRTGSGMRSQTVRAHGSAGFSLIELILVLGLATTVSAIAIGVLGSMSAVIQGDADMRLIEQQLRLARETAINQRRSIEIRFTPPNMIQTVRRDLPAGTSGVSTAALEHHAIFMIFTGQGDTPDGFGNPTATSFTAAGAVMFTSDGMFTDANGNPVNGSIFIGQPNKPMTARALTIFGPTASIRTFRWNGSAWRR